MKCRLLFLAIGTITSYLIGIPFTSRAEPQNKGSQNSPSTTTPQAKGFDSTGEALEEISHRKVRPLDWPQWGGTTSRNNTPLGKNIPARWNIDTGTNILWKAKLGSQTHGTPVVSNGRVYVGTNNAAGYVNRFPAQVDLGCLLCFSEKTGDFLWQYSSPKLPAGRVQDWPLQGICCSPFVEGERLWLVTNRGEVVCLDTNGFLDGENDGPFKKEANQNTNEADVVWRFDMLGELGIFQHNMCNCSVTCAGDLLFVNTSNGQDESQLNLPSPAAPSFLAMNRNTGKVVWTDNSPGGNILHGQWSSPAYGVLGGRPQVLFAGGDGWLYSFDPQGDGKGQSKLLWKFDCNPKDSKWILGGRGTRNNLLATPVIYDSFVYLAVGQDPEHGEGNGHLWCIDPTGSGDVSPTLAQGPNGKPLAPRGLQAVNPERGEKIVPNPNSKVVWHYDWSDSNGNGKRDFLEEMHRSCGTVAIKNDLLYIADFSGLFHCLDARKVAKDGKPVVYWTYDLLAPTWGSPLIVDDKVYIGDEDGDIAVFTHSTKRQLLAEINIDSCVYTSPIVANNVLYITNKNTLFAIGSKKERK